MKANTIFTVVLCFIFGLSFAQKTENTRVSKFNLDLSINVGTGRVDNENQPNYNLDAIVSEALLTYNFSNQFGVATGIGYTQLSGNGFNSNGNFYHERDVIRIPLMLTTGRNFGEKLRLYANIGLYGQVIVNDEFQYLTNTENDVYEGWSFGFNGNIGLLYELTTKFSMGVNFATQSDFSAVETSDNASINDEQRLDRVNTFGLLFRFSL